MKKREIIVIAIALFIMLIILTFWWIEFINVKPIMNMIYGEFL
jgi:hypothetical protein